MANSDDPVAFSFNGSTVYDSDIQTLAPEEWVGDAIIMLLFSLLEEEAHSSDIELWSPAVVQLLCTTDESSLGEQVTRRGSRMLRELTTFSAFI
ncbi:hypothetical protein OC845_005995 [Tilletia horrida]|nr:hypothetical protein OC845_005995 [Tilletia horrida]